MSLNYINFHIFEKNKNGRPTTDDRRKEIAEVEKSAEKIWNRWNYFFYSKRYHHFYPNLFSWKKLLGDYQGLCCSMV